MNFFKTVFSDPADEQQHHQSEESNTNSPSAASGGDEISGGSPAKSPTATVAGAWDFGGLIKTLASKSESVIETYGRDLKEFGEGLRKETVTLRSAASRAVDAAHDSLETVGQAIDDIGGSVSGLILQIAESENGDPQGEQQASFVQNHLGSAKRYSRFEAQLHALQSDPGTYSAPPDDEIDFGEWMKGFRIEEKKEDIESILHENSVVEGVMERLVPGVVDNEMFWCRYFYKVHKLKMAEDARAKLVKRVIDGEEEELSWEVDDDEEEEQKQQQQEELRIKGSDSSGETKEKEIGDQKEKEVVEALTEVVEEKKDNSTLKDENLETSQVPDKPREEENSKETDVFAQSNTVARTEEDVKPEAKAETVESCKDSDISVVSTQPSIPEEDDMGWDEIEDLGEHGDKKVSTSGSPKRIDLRKRLSGADDEDLSWDIEDDEQPAKP